jgi:hypothetical protein
MKGKVYRIEFSDGYFYIGSTIHNLKERLQDHKRLRLSHLKENLKSGNWIPKTPFDIYLAANGWNNPSISTHTDCEFEHVREMREIEYNIIAEHINDPKCLNCRSPNAKRKPTETERLCWLEGHCNSKQEPWREFWIHKVLENWHISPFIYPFGKAIEEFISQKLKT